MEQNRKKPTTTTIHEYFYIKLKKNYLEIKKIPTQNKVYVWLFV